MDPTLIFGALIATDTMNSRFAPAPARAAFDSRRPARPSPAWRRATATTLVRFARRLEPGLA